MKKYLIKMVHARKISGWMGGIKSGYMDGWLKNNFLSCIQISNLTLVLNKVTN
jgi:hypothetical protein